MWETVDHNDHDWDDAILDGDIPRLFDDQSVPQVEIQDGGENAGAWDDCDIASVFNDIRKQNEQDEIHDPDCNTDTLDKDVEDLLEELSS